MFPDYFGGQLDQHGGAAGFLFRSHKYFGDFDLTALQVKNNQQITLRGPEAFFAIMRLMSTSTGAFRAQIYTSSTERYHSGGHAGATTDRVRGECLFGTASRPGVLPVPIIVPAHANIILDLEDVSNAVNSLHLVFDGCRLFAR
jgi:hypothetical protein